LISPTTLTEFSLVALKRLGLDVIRRSIIKLTSGAIIVLDITEKDVIAATELFNAQRSKNESLCDCFVMALAKRTGARCIFSFDQGYPKNNFGSLGLPVNVPLSRGCNLGGIAAQSPANSR